ncbi:MAG: 4Fe-4S dicluster domain-containing protein [Deltaproteobacteria bacterium]|nr:4Fe-4S dicluster domain-containing protein [Deltaproteobacteria bacterium]MBW2307764.1 4Fe-4S dicluster domain-containing protein [Deltaproteobacteria bacterium]
MKEIIVDVSRCTGCKTCELQCALMRDSLSQKFPEAMYEEIVPLPRVKVEPLGEDASLPLQCRHCQEAACLDACPSGALYREHNGTVLYREQRCIGCWMCVMVCPFGVVEPRRAAKKVIKCDRCTGMEEPYCVTACPTGALVFAEAAQLAPRIREGLRERVLELLSDGRKVRLDITLPHGG